MVPSAVKRYCRFSVWRWFVDKTVIALIVIIFCFVCFQASFLVSFCVFFFVVIYVLYERGLKLYPDSCKSCLIINATKFMPSNLNTVWVQFRIKLCWYIVIYLWVIISQLLFCLFLCVSVIGLLWNSTELNAQHDNLAKHNELWSLVVFIYKHQIMHQKVKKKIDMY